MNVEQMMGRAVVLTEGSMYERLRRRADIEWDPHLAHAALIYSDAGTDVLAEVHREYIAVARAHGLPMLLSTATTKANRERLDRSGFAHRRVNQDNVTFVQSIREAESATGPPLYVGAGIGPKGNAYRPEQSLEIATAERFHAYQAEALAESAPDLVLGLTLPALKEARGMARALEATGLPYVLSFVIRDSGAVLDGTPLGEAFERIDQERARPPLGYFVNCVHPSVLDRGLSQASDQVRRRLIGFRGNTADKTPEELDVAEELIAEEPVAFAKKVVGVARRLDLKFVGGCCGAGTAHTEQIARACLENA